MPVKDSATEPRLGIIPSHLDFGIFDPLHAAPDSGTKEIVITNRGGGILAGRINPQTPWISISPSSFRCQAGESSVHKVTLLAAAPKSWKPQKFKYDFLFLIHSNGGSASLSGEYTASADSNSSPFSIPWMWIGMTALLAVLAAGLVLGIIFVRSKLESRETRQANLLYTQGAATEMARLNATTTATTATAQPVLANPAGGTAPQNSDGVVAAAPTQVQPVFTPWPRDQFPNPEQFIQDYYSSINYGNYEKSWTMLSQKFQQTCCSVGGNDPFSVYSNWWRTIKRVEVLAAFVQEWDTNPALVHVSLRYHTVDERTLDTFNVFVLLADAERKTLVIDEVK